MLSRVFSDDVQTMVDTVEERDSWLAFPSLLSSVSSAERKALEEAACAAQCGRYQDADFMFDSKLPSPNTSLVLALQRADTLSASGRVHQQIEVLEAMLAVLSLDDLIDHPCLEMLLQLHLAEAKFYARGELSDEELYTLLREFRMLLRGRTLESLSDLEVE